MKFLDDAVKKTLKKPILEVARRGKAPSDEVPEDTTVGGDKGFRANFWGWIKYFWREYADGITETQTYNSHRFAHQFGFDKGILGHFSTLVLPVVVASLAFKKENIIKILVSSPKIPFTSPPKMDYPHPGLSHGGPISKSVLGILGKMMPNEWMSHLSFREI